VRSRLYFFLDETVSNVNVELVRTAVRDAQ